jgi:predicted branched-subunit amino acid permease
MTDLLPPQRAPGEEPRPTQQAAPGRSLIQPWHVALTSGFASMVVASLIRAWSHPLVFLAVLLAVLCLLLVGVPVLAAIGEVSAERIRRRYGSND